MSDLRLRRVRAENADIVLDHRLACETPVDHKLPRTLSQACHERRVANQLLQLPEHCRAVTG